MKGVGKIFHGDIDSVVGRITHTQRCPCPDPQNLTWQSKGPDRSPGPCKRRQEVGEWGDALQLQLAFNWRKGPQAWECRRLLEVAKHQETD